MPASSIRVAYEGSGPRVCADKGFLAKPETYDQIYAYAREMDWMEKPFHFVVSRWLGRRNTALVEEAAAAAGSRQEQASNLSEVVSVFKLDNGKANHVAAPQRTAALKQHPAPKHPPRAKQALAARQRKQLAGAPAAGGDWETF